MGRSGAQRAQRFDVAALVRGFDADVVVVPEAFRFDNGRGVLDPLSEDGYAVHTTHFGQLEERVHRPGDVRPAGVWELAVCSRLPVTSWREFSLGRVFRDPVGARSALACTIRVGGVEVEFFGFHASSKLWYAGPLTHLRRLSRETPNGDRPAVLAGDFNFWGPPVSRLLPGWRRAVLGPTWPAHRPHSQIDHVFVNDHIEVLGGVVLPECGSDHRPIRAQLVVR